MKNKIWMCLIIFAIVIINISCNNETEGNTISSEKSLNDDLEYTDESLAEESSIYRNPIDQYFKSKLYSWDASQVELREAQREYQKAWKAEYKNLMKWMKKSVFMMKTGKILVYWKKVLLIR